MFLIYNTKQPENNKIGYAENI